MTTTEPTVAVEMLHPACPCGYRLATPVTPFSAPSTAWVELTCPQCDAPVRAKFWRQQTDSPHASA
jgi:hypothetical protein